MMLDLPVNILELLAGPLGGGVAGWVLVQHFSREADKKDNSHLKAVEQHIMTLQQEASSCANRYDVLLKEVLAMKKGRSAGR